MSLREGRGAISQNSVSSADCVILVPYIVRLGSRKQGRLNSYSVELIVIKQQEAKQSPFNSPCLSGAVSGQRLYEHVVGDYDLGFAAADSVINCPIDDHLFLD